MVCLYVSLSVTIMSPAKIAEPIEMLLGLWTQVGPSKHVLDGVPDPSWEGAISRGGEVAASCKVEGLPSMCGGNAAFCHITLTICCYYQWTYYSDVEHYKTLQGHFTKSHSVQLRSQVKSVETGLK